MDSGYELLIFKSSSANLIIIRESTCDVELRLRHEELFGVWCIGLSVRTLVESNKVVGSGAFKLGVQSKNIRTGGGETFLGFHLLINPLSCISSRIWNNGFNDRCWILYPVCA